MYPTHLLNAVLWIVQSFLAVFFLLAGLPKVLGRGMERWTGFSDLPRAEVLFIGIAEVLGAAGLVLPMAMNTLRWLTPLAAIGLAVVVLMAAGFHLRADERLNAVETVLWGATSAVVAIGRWNLVADLGTIPSWVIVAGLAVLLPSAIVNVVILLRRPVVRGAPARP